MTIRCPLRAPSGILATGEILDFIQRILNVRSQIGDKSAIQRVAGINCQYRFHLQVLAPFGKLKQAQAVNP